MKSMNKPLMLLVAVALFSAAVTARTLAVRTSNETVAAQSEAIRDRAAFVLVRVFSVLCPPAASRLSR